MLIWKLKYTKIDFRNFLKNHKDGEKNQKNKFNFFDRIELELEFDFVYLLIIVFDYFHILTILNQLRQF